MSEENPGDLTAVLVVDDNDTDAQFMKAVIEKAGYQVTTAANGVSGEALIVGQKWAIAFVDLILPGDKDGVEVIQSGRKQHPHLPIIIVTGSSNAAFIDAAFRAGADAKLSKPIEPEEILRQLRSLSQKEGAPVGTGPTPTEAPEPAAVPVPTVVAVGAIPGDVEMGCGGILSKHRHEGHRIIMINTAGGGNPHSSLHRTALSAAALLEAQVENMGDETGQMADPEEVTAKLKEVFESASPGMLYVPTLSSDQPSSVESHRIALAVSEGIPNVLAYQDPRANVDFRPRFFVDLAPHMKRKLELVAIYDGSGLENVSTELAQATALFWGRFAQHRLAEPLEVVRSGSG